MNIWADFDKKEIRSIWIIDRALIKIDYKSGVKDLFYFHTRL